MSDKEDFNLSEESEDEDFSPSEDDWNPDKCSDKESDDSFDAVPNETSESKKREKKGGKMKTGTKRPKAPKRLSLSLRTKLYNKYKPPPKSLHQMTKSTDLSNILSLAELKRRKAMRTSEKQTPIPISPSATTHKKTSPVSDSSDSEDFEEVPETKTTDPKPFLGRLSDGSSDEEVVPINLNELVHRNEQFEATKQRIMEMTNKRKEQERQPEKIDEPILNDDFNVTTLLAMGETSAERTEPERKKSKKRMADSDSEWEVVEDTEQPSTSQIKDVEITVEPSLVQRAKKTKSNDLEAMLKRKLNLVRKSNQMILHRTHVLCWLAHGNYVNRCLNNHKLMSLGIKLLPSKSCYPKDRTNVKYFEQITRWFSDHFSVVESKGRPPLQTRLCEDMKLKRARSEKDLILIFIVLLRTIGIQCRLVLNLAVVPLRPPQSDLLSLKVPNIDLTKDEAETSASSKPTIVNKVIANTKETKKSDDKPETTSKSKLPIKDVKVTLKTDRILSVEPTKQPVKSKPEAKPVRKDNETSLSAKLAQEEVKIRRSERKTSKTAVESNQTNKSNRTKLDTPIEDKLKSADPTKTKTHLKVPEKATKQQLLKDKKNITPSPTSQPVNRPVKKDTKRLLKIKLPEIKKSSKTKTLNENDDEEAGPSNRSSKRRPPSRVSNRLKIDQLDGATGPIKRRKVKQSKVMLDENSDSDFAASPPKRTKRAPVKPVKKPHLSRLVDRRLLSTDIDENDKESNSKIKRCNQWIEVYSEEEEQWISIDLLKKKVHCVDDIKKTATKPITYVFAWNNNNTIKDVSARYCSQWNTVTRKSRVDSSWLDQALQRYRGKTSPQDRIEDRELNKIHLEKPLPTAISEYKNHPLYALKRHLLKFEGIYPENALTLGFIRNEPVYARECVHTLHSREIWVKQARVVKPKQQPYKIVKARPKWDRHTNSMLEAQPLELFGRWQTKKYEPPTAENGIVPRNAYGNVELFKPEMLPKKTVHLQLPGLNRTCKKMNIDCAQAVIGFDFHSGSSHPTFDGFVVCEEFAESVVEQWWKDQEEAERKEEEKYEKRVYGNWKKLIKGLMIREHLQKKYNFKKKGEENDGEN